jgi:60 kDa SS-A/Ro ribonucleoprotein
VTHISITLKPWLPTDANGQDKEASPKLVNIDLKPYQTVQAYERPDIMNIGGLSDSVFNVTSAFLANNNQRFVAEVEAIPI